MVTLQNLATKTPLQNAMSSMGVQAKQPLAPTTKPVLPTGQIQPFTPKPSMATANTTPQVTTSSSQPGGALFALKNSPLINQSGMNTSTPSYDPKTQLTPYQKSFAPENALGANTSFQSTSTPTKTTTGTASGTTSTYKGVPITGKTDAEIAQQVKSIDAKQTTPSTPTGISSIPLKTNIPQTQTTPSTPTGISSIPLKTNIPQTQTPQTQYTPQTQGLTQSGLIQQLMGLQQGYEPLMTQSAQKLADIQQETQTALYNNNTMPAESDIMTGRAGMIQQIGAERAQVEQQKLTNLQNALSQRAGIVGQGVTATAPQMQAGMLTNPQTGQPLNPSLVSNAVQQASQLVQNGTDVNSPQIQALLNPFGYYGASAFTQAQQALSGGTFNPTAQSAMAQTSAGIGSKYQQETVALSVPLNQVQTSAVQLADFMQRASLNTDPQVWKNKTYNQLVLETTNPADKATLNMAQESMKNYLSQIISAQSGLNVNAVTEGVNSYDFGALPAGEFMTFMNNVVAEGNTRKAELERTALGGYGQTGMLPYLGSSQQTQPFTQLQTGTTNQMGTAGTVGNVLANTAVNAPTAVASFIGGIFNAFK